jgi:hypothetical protein
VTVAPAFLTLAVPADDELALIQRMVGHLAVYGAANQTAAAYYEGSQTTQQFGISIPPSMQTLKVVAGWGGTVVDVLEERLDWLGWASEGDDFGLGDVFAANMLDVDSGLAHLDSLIYGTSFVSVGTGMDGEPSPLVTPHSPLSTTGLWDRRSRRLAAACSVVSDQGQIVEVTLYLPDQTVTVAPQNGTWVVLERDMHNLGRVPLVQMPNRIRGSREEGRSEITKAVRYYTDAAVRTMLGLEVNREFYNAPQRVGLNIPEDAFTDGSGNAISQWSAIMGRVWMLPPNEDDDGTGPAPDVKQFSPSSPAPYLDQVRGYATLLAAEAGIPTSYLGFQTDNPASADAIRAGEARLVKRAERRQTVFGRAWLEVARLALLVRDGSVPDTFDSVSVRWRDAATPTRAAAADEATKLIAAGVLPPDSTVTYDRVGLTPPEQRQIAADKRRTQGSAVLNQILAAQGNGNSGTPAP